MNRKLIDLHMHFDGAITPANARKLAALLGVSIPEDETELKKLLMVNSDCKDLNEFLQCFDFPLSLMQTKESLKMAAKNLLLELKEEGLIYVEPRFAPQLHCQKGLTQEEVLTSVIEGMNEADLPYNLILCCMRFADNHKENIETIDLAKKYYRKGVAAVDLAGAEALFPAKDYKDLFDYAKELGLPFTIHAGEADGPESIRTALSFDPQRIGHGVRCIEDEELVKLLASKKIPLELCPTSNIMTCIFKDMSMYPIRKLIDAGVVVTLNTDDPGIEGINLIHEYEQMEKYFAFTEDEFKTLLKNSINASFATEELKTKLLKEM